MKVKYFTKNPAGRIKSVFIQLNREELDNLAEYMDDDKEYLVEFDHQGNMSYSPELEVDETQAELRDT